MNATNDIIAYQGFPGAYSHLACTRVYPQLTATACESFIQAMLMVDNGSARLAMIPLENSTAGRVEEIYRLMPKTRLHIIGEHFEPVNHCLLGLPGSRMEDLQTVSSHPQALASAMAISRRWGCHPSPRWTPPAPPPNWPTTPVPAMRSSPPAWRRNSTAWKSCGKTFRM